MTSVSAQPVTGTVGISQTVCLEWCSDSCCSHVKHYCTLIKRNCWEELIPCTVWWTEF